MIPIPQQRDIKEVPISVLAYIGDAVYELCVRVHLYGEMAGPSGRLHRQSIEWVSAAAQAKAAHALMPQLHADEAAVFRRGRNGHAPSMAKNATPGEYQDATGFEAMIGYLYLTEKKDRIMELIDQVFAGQSS